ncbi:cell envelope integrity EipB family protein [Rhodospirillum centenum]|uniref:DUF1849 family protein n=1 Tax=Rhodospirillum centenum (strain ATCC 51521 / SW) TaxID=414684 RepID=B6IN42_RHOCS|nr:cell envelope integrity EipB family protein [Rhodospirillum centenum]ACI98939.1 conserved hypothetical protein [Rhodospirillum centenum SW]
MRNPNAAFQVRVNTTSLLRPACLRLLTAAALSVGVLIPFPGGAAASQVVPHLATYKLSLASSRSSATVTGVDGAMSYAWKDACDGWTVEQRFQVRFTYVEGEQVELSTSYVTWEAKDGSAYRFNVRKLTNGELEEELRGDATLNGADGGVARFERPDRKELALRPGTLFPTAHTIRMLDLARKGDNFLSAPIFDGSEADGASGVSALIAKPAKVGDLKTRSRDLVRERGWPVFMAFFPTDTQEMLPEYETKLTILDNGVVESMLIDYGDFKVRAVLESLEAAPKPPC